MMGMYFPHLKILYFPKESTEEKYQVNKITNSHHAPKSPLSLENLKPGLTNVKSRDKHIEENHKISGQVMGNVTYLDLYFNH